MDPLTIWAFCLITAWFVRGAVEDGIATVRGRESPRIARRRARQELDQQQAMTAGSPGIFQAFADRAAARIANPPARRFGPEARSYLDEVLADAVADARSRREEKRRKRHPPILDAEVVEVVEDATPDPAATCSQCRTRPALADSDRCAECRWGTTRAPVHHCIAGCGVPVAFAGRACADCRIDREQRQQAVADKVADESAPGPDTTTEGAGPMAYECAYCGQRTAPQPTAFCAACVARWQLDDLPAADTPSTPPPAPTPGPATTEGTPMSQPTGAVVIDGDINDPTGARARAQACIDTVQEIIGQADVCASNLEGLGVGAEAVGEIRGVDDDLAPYIAAGQDAIQVFNRHATAQAEIAANADLSGTTAGTYLDGARA